MPSIGAGEILVVALVALIVLGPDKLPEAARKIGQVIAEVRKVSSGFQAELRDALHEPVEGAPPTMKRSPTPTATPAPVDPDADTADGAAIDPADWYGGGEAHHGADTSNGSGEAAAQPPTGTPTDGHDDGGSRNG